MWKGKRNAGRMGGKKRWQRSLAVHRIDTRYNLVYVTGSVPGSAGVGVGLQLLLTVLLGCLQSRVLVRDTLMHLGQRPEFITRPKGSLDGQ